MTQGTREILTRMTHLSGEPESTPVGVPYSSLHRFAVKHCGFHERRRITVRIADVEPGELAEVDFGRLGLVPDPQTARRRCVVHALIVTLVYSRHQYVHVTTTQKIPDLIDGLEDAWEYFGGVTARVVLDNLRAAVTKADRYEPVFQRTFEEYGAHRGFVIDAAVPRHPKGKPHVERQVQYVRESFFRGEDWHDVAHVQREATLSGTFPWAHLRQAQRLLRIGNKYGRHRLDSACHRALHFDLIHVGRVQKSRHQAARPQSHPGCSAEREPRRWRTASLFESTRESARA